MNGNFFWGILLLLFGASLLLKTLFGLDIPLVRTFLGIFLLYCGLMVITNAPFFTINRSGVFYSEHTHRSSHKHSRERYKKYDIIFGSGEIDLSTIPLESEGITMVKVNVVFGDGTVIINPAIPTIMKAKSIFASTTLPDASTVTFGNQTYRNHQTQKPQLILKTKAVFGSLKIVNAQNSQRAEQAK